MHFFTITASFADAAYQRVDLALRQYQAPVYDYI